jgi:uncharacterized protein YrrD
MRLRALRHRPVVAARSGQHLGKVAQILVDLDGRRVAGFRLRSGGLFDRRWRLAALEDVIEVTDTAVVLPDALALREDESWVDCLALGGRRLPVRDPTGSVVGELVDVEADVTTGQVCAVFVTSHTSAWMRSPLAEALPACRLRRGGNGAIVKSAPPMTPRESATPSS